MRNDQDLLPGLSGKMLVPRGEHARFEVRQRFRAGRRILQRVVPKACEVLRVRHQQFGGGFSFPGAEVNLLQACIQLQRQGMALRQLNGKFRAALPGVTRSRSPSSRGGTSGRTSSMWQPCRGR